MEVKVTRVEGDDLDIARAAWVSTKGSRAEEQDPVRVSGLINALMRERHGSPFEQVGLQFLTSAPIFVWREHYRHRIASYNEESGRYKQLDPVFYIPHITRPLVQVPGSKQMNYELQAGTRQQYESFIKGVAQSCTEAYELYESALEAGIVKEMARISLPLNIYSTAYVRMNLRALMNFLSLRVRSEASAYPSKPQHEINMVADKYEQAFKEHFPVTHAAFVKNGRVAP